MTDFRRLICSFQSWKRSLVLITTYTRAQQQGISSALNNNTWPFRRYSLFPLMLQQQRGGAGDRRPAEPGGATGVVHGDRIWQL